MEEQAAVAREEVHLPESAGPAVSLPEREAAPDTWWTG